MQAALEALRVLGPTFAEPLKVMLAPCRRQRVCGAALAWPLRGAGVNQIRMLVGVVMAFVGSLGR